LRRSGRAPQKRAPGWFFLAGPDPFRYLR